MTTFTVLGCDGSYAGPGGACTGYLLRSRTTSIWLDAGPGTLSRVQQYLPASELDAVVVTHEHPDHFVDLPVFYNACKWYLGVSGLPVITTAGVHRLTDAVVGSATDDVFEWQTVSDGDTVSIGDIDVSFSETDHPVETLATRLDTPEGSVGFTSDTGPAWHPASLGAALDLLVSEATMPPGYSGDASHLSATQAGERAREAEAARLAITHLTPGADPKPYLEGAATAYGAAVELALADVTWKVMNDAT
jgi:ribonuclease BN (tRNA processing enzyme)